MLVPQGALVSVNCPFGPVVKETSGLPVAAPQTSQETPAGNGCTVPLGM